MEKKPATPLDIDKITEYINEWITWEIINRGDIVGPPIDILRITKSGAEWIQHKKECPEIDNSFFKKAN